MNELELSKNYFQTKLLRNGNLGGVCSFLS
jgi:hypothetical protein